MDLLAEFEYLEWAASALEVLGGRFFKLFKLRDVIKSEFDRLISLTTTIKTSRSRSDVKLVQYFCYLPVSFKSIWSRLFSLHQSRQLMAKIGG